MTIRLFPLILGVLSLATVGLAQAPAAKYPRAIPREEAFRLLDSVNDRGELVPESVTFEKMKISGLASEDCFGVEPAGGWQLVGQSGGKNYGMQISSQGPSGEFESPLYAVGFLYSTAAFVVADKTLQAGGYLVYARTDALQFTGNAKTFFEYRGRQIPNQTSTKIELPNKLNAALLEEKSKERPRFSLVLEGKQMALVIGENKFPIRQK